MHLLPEVDCGPKAWTMLKELHAPTSVVATLMLERELSALRLSEGEPVQPVLDKMRDLYAKLATVGISYPEQTKCLKMLSLLPESWLQFTSGLSLPQNQSLWTLEWVRTKRLKRISSASTTASAASATSTASATPAAATAATASTAAADTSTTTTTTPTTTPTPSTASTTASTAPATPTSAPAPLAPASAAAPARGRRSTDRLETTKETLLEEVNGECGGANGEEVVSDYAKGVREPGDYVVESEVEGGRVLGTELSRKRSAVACITSVEVLNEEKFIKEPGEKYGIENERKVATPLPAEFKLLKAAEDEGVEAEEQQQFQSLVGSLLYANPSEEQVDAAERVVKYLNSHPSIGVQYSASAQVKQKGVEVPKEKKERLGEGKLFLTCFTDATWASEKDDSLSVGGYICVVGGGPVSWRSKKQTKTALSSVESEYVEMFHGEKEVIWPRRLLEEIGQEQQVATPLYFYSKGALGMARNTVLHGLNKHMHI
ncbi:unnamed protein product [Closterium sp. NIES-53]